MKIGVYVGSFNPVHLGHTKIVNYLLENYLDKIIIIPTGNYWDKMDLVSIQDRINMLKIFENDKIIIDTKNNNILYTYEILNNLKNKYNNLYLIIGADNIINFDKWKNYEELLTYNLVIINRDDINIKYYLNKLNKKDNYIITETLPNIDISSTYIRKCIKDNDYKELENKVDKRVLNYIEEKKLYK